MRLSSGALSLSSTLSCLGSKKDFLLWSKALPSSFELESGLSLRKIAKEHKLSGANITNIVAYCIIQAEVRKSHNTLRRGFTVCHLKGTGKSWEDHLTIIIFLMLDYTSEITSTILCFDYFGNHFFNA